MRAVLALTLVLVPEGRSWILEAGQRIAPRRVMTTTPDEPTRLAASPAAKRSLLDLEALEAWASERGLKPFHVKRVYDAFLRGGDPSGGVGRGRRPAAAAALVAGLGAVPELTVEDLCLVEFPKRDAAALLESFSPCMSRVVDRQRSSSGGSKLIVELSPSNNTA